MDLSQMPFIAGKPEEWGDFAARHRAFLERLPRLMEAVDVAFGRTLTQSKPIEKFIFGYGRLCCEDFQEVLLLSANGYGIGALKQLRSLYEHAVTLSYLDEHPEELDLLYDYAYVSQFRAYSRLIEIFGDGPLESKGISGTQITSDFEKVKDDRFMITCCKKCETKRPNHTWNKLDFVSMAKKCGGLGDLIVAAYYVPLTHAHSSSGTLTARLAPLDGGGLTFVSTAQRKEADLALGTAHRIMLKVLAVQYARFGIPELSEKLQLCLQSFDEIWNKPSSDSAASRPSSP